MATSAEYREYAAQSLALAERVSNPLDRARLIEMAQDFLQMAKKSRTAIKVSNSAPRPRPSSMRRFQGR